MFVSTGKYQLFCLHNYLHNYIKLYYKIQIKMFVSTGKYQLFCLSVGLYINFYYKIQIIMLGPDNSRKFKNQKNPIFFLWKSQWKSEISRRLCSLHPRIQRTDSLKRIREFWKRILYFFGNRYRGYVTWRHSLSVWCHDIIITSWRAWHHQIMNMTSFIIVTWHHHRFPNMTFDSSWRHP